MRATKPLGAELGGFRAGCVGVAYRALIGRLDDDARLVRVMRIAHRADVYRLE